MTPLGKLYALHALAACNQETFGRAKDLGLEEIAAELRAVQLKINKALADHVNAKLAPSQAVAS
jgi:hypothetical protein